MSSYFSPSCREYLGGWIKLKDEIPTEENVCEFCAADNEECGEWQELCYKALMEEIKMRDGK